MSFGFTRQIDNSSHRSDAGLNCVSFVVASISSAATVSYIPRQVRQPGDRCLFRDQAAAAASLGVSGAKPSFPCPGIWFGSRATIVAIRRCHDAHESYLSRPIIVAERHGTSVFERGYG